MSFAVFYNNTFEFKRCAINVFFEVLSLLCRLVDYFQETTFMYSRIPLRSKPHVHATNRSNILYNIVVTTIKR